MRVCLLAMRSVECLQVEVGGGVAVSVLHGGGELEVGDTNVVVTAVQENVGLGGRGTKRGEWRTAEGRVDIIIEPR